MARASKPKYKSLELLPVPSCPDVNGKALRIGAPVKSTSGYEPDGSTVTGKIVSTLTRDLVEVEHLSGDNKGLIYRSASRLWRAV